MCVIISTIPVTVVLRFAKDVFLTNEFNFVCIHIYVNSCVHAEHNMNIYSLQYVQLLYVH